MILKFEKLKLGMGSRWKYEEEEERAQYRYGSQQEESPKEDPIEK